VQEIAEVRWMPMQEYRKTDHVQQNPAILALVECMEAYVWRGYRGFTVRKLQYHPSKKPEHLLADGLATMTGADSALPEGRESEALKL
jgi:hypothetical protein